MTLAGRFVTCRVPFLQTPQDMERTVKTINPAQEQDCPEVLYDYVKYEMLNTIFWITVLQKVSDIFISICKLRWTKTLIG